MAARRARARRARARRAGVIAPQILSAAPTLPATARFNGDVWGDAFWMGVNRGEAVGTLYVSSGARLVRDCLSDLGQTGGQSTRMWTQGLLDLLGQRVGALGGQVPTVRADATLPLEWLRAAVWATYCAETYPRNVSAVVFPRTIVLPPMGEPLGLGDQATRALNNFRPAMLASNPFEVTTRDGSYQGENIDVTGGGGSKKNNSGASSSSSTATVVAVVALGVALLSSDKGG